MGQRLVITVYNNTKDNQPIAAIYYHWSGYTRSGLDELSKLQHVIEKNDNFIPSLLNCLSIPKQTVIGEYCGSLMEDDIEYYTNTYYQNYELPEIRHRNEGILAIQPESIEQLQLWAEANLYIYLDEQLFEYEGLLWSIRDGDEDFEDFDKSTPYTFDKSFVLPLTELNKLIAIFDDIAKNYNYMLETASGEYYSMIE